MFNLITVVRIFGHTVFITERLEFAAAGTYARGAFSVMIGKQKFEICSSCFTELFVICIDLHTLGNGESAGCLRCSAALCFDKADTTCAYLVDALEVAERGDIYSCFASGFDNGIVSRNRYVYAVNS